MKEENPIRACTYYSRHMRRGLAGPINGLSMAYQYMNDQYRPVIPDSVLDFFLLRIASGRCERVNMFICSESM